MTHGRVILASLSYRAAVCVMALACLLMEGCGTGFSPPFPAAIYSPAPAVRVNQTMQLTTNSVATGSPLMFWVNGVLGGNAEIGTIDKNGLYTAPAIVPVPSNVITITSKAVNFPQDPGGSVTLNVWNPIPVVTVATPSSFAEGTELVTIKGSQFIYGAQIFWNGVAVPTTYVSGTELAAAISAPNPGTFNVGVTNPDPGSANSAALSEKVGPGQVVLTLNTYAGTSVRVNNSISMALAVNGTNNTAVTWSLNGTPAGNAQIGTFVANTNGSVTYTAPAVVPTPGNIVQLRAVSADDPTVFITQNVSVLNPIPLLTSATPMAFDIGPATVVVNGAKFITGAQVLANGIALPTTFNSGGQLTATLNVTDPGTLDLQVLNPSPGPATSTDLIADVNGTPPTQLVAPTDASRFLTQATFGPNDSDIHHLSKIGYTAWLNEQFATPQTLHEPHVEKKMIVNNPACMAGDLKCNATLFLSSPNNQQYLEQSFWQQAMTGDDQLRQRVKYSLSQIMVVSGNNPAAGNMPRGLANYYDMLGKDAFGNFRQLLEDVTLSPTMGVFLNMQGNDKGDATRDPDENYAREVMQLLTIGLYQLNPDGTQQLDATGNPIPTYTNNDVMGLARVFTGYSWNVPGDTSDTAWSNCCIYVGTGFGEDLLNMQGYPSHHSTEAKSFLGVNIAAGGSSDPSVDLKVALDTLFNHPNTGPFFARQMIGHLVTSNPSPAYVGRVSAVFADNGSGVRGDMKAVIQAILLDDEARDAQSAAANPQYGKVRESLVRYVEWARAFTAQSRNGGFIQGSTEDRIYGLGEMALRSPTVFNWFAPGYTPPGTSIQRAGLIAPEMQMTDVSTVVGYLNYMQGAIATDSNSGQDVFSNYDTEIGLAATPDLLMDRINLLLMAGSMNSTLRSQVLSAVNSIAIPAEGVNAINTALLNRVQIAIYLTMASPAYSAQI